MRMQVVPLGSIQLFITSGEPTNFCKELLTFEVVTFSGTYHALLKRPCYVKFMVVLHYACLKLKMSGPHGGHNHEL